MIPVAPGAHYSCGGILADLDGQTSIPGLYAVGEAASTGVQGANRLASNSVTEAIIAGRRAGRVIATRAALQVIEPHRDARGDENSGDGAVPAAGCTIGNADRIIGGNACAADSEVPGGRRALALAMSRWAGVMRDREGLTELARAIAAAEGAVGVGEAAATGSQMSEGRGAPGSVPYADFDLDLEAVEAANLRLVSGLIAAAALRRAESRGCHRRRDAAGTAERPWHTLVRWDGQEFTVNEEEL
jgi:L-aspartate oxidase